GFEFFPDPWQLVTLTALETGRVGGVAMQLDDVIRRDAGSLMEIVNVLRNQARHLARAIETRDRSMAAAGLRPTELVLHGEPAAPGLVPHLLVRHEGVERDRLHLRPDPAGRTKIRNATLGGDPCPGEWDDRLGLLDQIAEPRDCRWKIGCNHSYIVSVACQSVRFSPCDTCTPCSASATWMPLLIFIATSLA